MIIDYSFWRPSALPDVEAVLRYLSHDDAKSASAHELAWHHREGRATALVFEDTANRAAEGAAAGSADGAFVRALAAKIAVPHHATIYAACDFDVPDYAPTSSSAKDKLGPVGAYLETFGRALGPDYQLGAYGSFYVCQRASWAGITHRTWQTLAWSGGQLWHDVSLYQPGAKVFGNQADLNLAGRRDFGQFIRKAVTLVGAAA